jgi:hypothetical protein
VKPIQAKAAKRIANIHENGAGKVRKKYAPTITDRIPVVRLMAFIEEISQPASQ